MKIKPVVGILLASFWMSSTALAGGEVAIFPVSGTDLQPGEAETIGTLFAQAYARASKAQVMAPAETAKIAAAAGNLYAAAQALAAFEYVDVVAARKGGRLHLIAALFNNKGEMLHKVELTALSLEDFRMMVGRMATALVERKSVAEIPSSAVAPDPKTLKHTEHSPALPSGGEVAVFPVVGTNLAPGTAAAVGVVFAHAYNQVSGQQVLMPDETAGILTRSNDYQKAAQILAAAEFIVIRAVRLENEIRVVATLYRSDGKQAHWVQMTTHSLDEFQDIALRMSHALYHRMSMEEAPPPQTYTSAETRVLPPRPGMEWIVGVKLQASAVVAIGAAFDPTVTVMFDIRFEGDSYFVEAAAGAIFPMNAWQDDSLTVHQFGGVVADLGFNYYLFDGDISVYLGGGVIPRLIGGDGLDPSVRIALYGQGGVMFFRESSMRLYTDLQIGQNVIPFQYLAEARSQVHEFWPTEITLSVGFGF